MTASLFKPEGSTLDLPIPPPAPGVVRHGQPASVPRVSTGVKPYTAATMGEFIEQVRHLRERSWSVLDAPITLAAYLVLVIWFLYDETAAWLARQTSTAKGRDQMTVCVVASCWLFAAASVVAWLWFAEVAR